MIASLRGRLVSCEGNQVILEVGGIGFALTVPATTRDRLPLPGTRVSLHTHLCVREDGFSLFGFGTVAELRAFQLMLGVSGIGPRLAVAVISHLGPDGLYRAVARDDAAMLARVPGIGRKTAQRLIIELQEKVGTRTDAGAGPDFPPAVDYDEAATALMSLGYTGTEAHDAVAAARTRLGAEAPLAEIVRQGLRHLARG